LLGDLVSSLWEASLRRKDFLGRTYNRSYDDTNVGTGTLFIFLIVHIFSFIYCFKKIIDVVHGYGYSGSISELIYRYRNLSIYTTESVSLGKIGDWLYVFSMASGYIWIYLIAERLASRKKINIILFVNLVVSILTDLMKGGRQSAVQLLVTGVIIFLLFYMGRNGILLKYWYL
jgi:oligosaccharide repeat unit polymerase